MRKKKNSIARRAGRWAVLSGLVLGVAIPSLMGGTANAATVFPSVVLGSGSDVMFHVASALDLLYNESPGCTLIDPNPANQKYDLSCDPQTGDITTENYAHDRITEAAPIGGSAGVTQLCSQGTAGVANIDYARTTSGPPKAPALPPCTGLKYVAYARDAISWEAFPKGKKSPAVGMNNQSGACAGSSGFCLTQQQLQGIYVNCSITNWNQIGGSKSAPIQAYTILPQFGTRTAFDKFLGGSSTSCGATQIDQTDNAAIPLKNQPFAIAPVSVGSWTERYGSAKQNSKLGAVDGVTPSVANISNGTFPYVRFLYNVYCAGVGSPAVCGTASPSTQATVNYIGEEGWICTANTHADDPITGVDYRTEIANTISQYGFVPLPVGPIGGGDLNSDYCRLFTT